MNSQELQEVDSAISEHRQSIELGQCLDRLVQNREFKRIILDGYLTEEAVRLVHKKGDPLYQSAEAQAAIVAQIDAIGRLVRYFNGIRLDAQTAIKQLETAEQLRDEILAEHG